jgi:hypothetical protein
MYFALTAHCYVLLTQKCFYDTSIGYKNVPQHFMKRSLHNGLHDLKRLPATKPTHAGENKG